MVEDTQCLGARCGVTSNRQNSTRTLKRIRQSLVIARVSHQNRCKQEKLSVKAALKEFDTLACTSRAWHDKHSAGVAGQLLHSQTSSQYGPHALKSLTCLPSIWAWSMKDERYVSQTLGSIIQCWHSCPCLPPLQRLDSRLHRPGLALACLCRRHTE